MYSTKPKILAFKCAKCFTEDSNLKLAWFVGSNSLYSDSLLCNSCFKFEFSKLNINEKREWAFYDK